MVRKSFIERVTLWLSLKRRQFPGQPRNWELGRDSRQKVQRDQYHRACSRFYEEFRECLVEWGGVCKEGRAGGVTKATSQQASEATLTSVCFPRAVETIQFLSKRVPISNLCL